jgi:hypothetical protein
MSDFPKVIATSFTDHQGERFQGEIELYRVVSTNHLHMRVSRYDHVDHKGKVSKRDHIHIIMDADTIAAILSELGKLL